ncbi:MAG TPA: glycosyltransferase family 2 protein [bacterium]|nr:glycosyltransferase family 2 protein [bacterium]
MNNPDISIVMVNWRVADLVEKNLRSIFTFTHNINYEVIVVDNSGSDGLADLLPRQFPEQLADGRLAYIDSGANLGFAKANNLGAKRARGRWLLFINPDMEIRRDIFRSLYDYYYQLPAAARGLLGTKLLYPNGETQATVKRDPDLLSQSLILLKLHHLLAKRWPLSKYLALDFDYNQPAEVEQLMGACIGVDRQLFWEKLDGWNEKFWLWWEDVDLCRTVRDLGLKNYYWPGAEIIHYEGKSFGKELPLRKQLWFIRGMYLYFYYHLRGWRKLFLLSFLLTAPLSILLSALVQLAKIKPRAQGKLASTVVSKTSIDNSTKIDTETGLLSAQASSLAVRNDNSESLKESNKTK